MKRTIALLFLATALSLTAAAQVEYVNPFIGTDGMGHTFPGACAPFGIVQLSPDTDTIPHNVNGIYQPDVYKYCAGYQYSDSTIVGFSHTHFSGTGHSDLGDLLVMPYTGIPHLNPGTTADPDGGYRSRFSHDSEVARPGYYEVMLTDYGIRAQLTATQRVGVHRYTYPEGAAPRFILDLQHGIYNYDGKTLWSTLRVENDTLLTGCRLTNGWARANYTYFAISLSKPLKDYGYRDLQRVPYNGFWRKFPINHHFPEMAGRKLVAWFDFDSNDDGDNALVIKVALSATSTDGALRNLQAEASGKSFDTIVRETSDAWQHELSAIEVEGTEEEKTMFYTSFYHTLINPSVYQDVDGRYRGLDQSIHQADGFTNYTIFSLWDTYRAEHPLLMLMKPQEARDMVLSMLHHQKQSVHGLLPIWSHMANDNWCMSGYHAVSVLSDAIAKGADIPADEALQAMIATSNVPYLDGMVDYLRQGYVPMESSGTSASNTLEYCYDDWAIYQAARNLGDESIADTYRSRALNYRNIFDPETRFARPKMRNGAFKTPFDPKMTFGEGFIEGNAWNFSFHVPHDIGGLMKQMGGEKTFVSRLDEMFAQDLDPKYYIDNEDIEAECLIGGYVHGNEPSHHIPYLYAWTTQPWKTQYWTREIMHRMYRCDIRGLGGNDDCGQMSAWYIFTVLGFYPVCPGTDQYVLGAPYLPHLTLHLPNGNTMEIRATGVSDRRRYVGSVTLNGQPHPQLYLTHDELLRGGVLEFHMQSQPNRHRGQRADDKPYSLTR